LDYKISKKQSLK